MRSFKPFALPSTLDYDVKKFTRSVKTKKWALLHCDKLGRTADRLTTAGVDVRQVIGGMLQTGYGVNIGRQIDDLLTDSDILKIKSNILSSVYNY